MNVYDPYGYYPDAALVGGVFRDEEKKQYVVEDPLGLNLYTYCHNNPITFNDPLGKFIVQAIGAAVGGIVGGALGALDAYISGKSVLGGVVGGFFGGAISGVLSTFGGGALVGALTSIGGNLISSFIESLFNDDSKPTRSDLLFDIGLSGVFGAFGGKLGTLIDDAFTSIGGELAGGFIDWIFGHVEMSVSAIKDMLFPKKSYAS